MEFWNKEAEYHVKSKDEKYKIKVKFEDFGMEQYARIECMNQDNLLHFFLVKLDETSDGMEYNKGA